MSNKTTNSAAVAAERREVFKSVALALLSTRSISALAYDGTLSPNFLQSVEHLAEGILAAADKFQSPTEVSAERKEIVQKIIEDHKELLKNLTE